MTRETWAVLDTRSDAWHVCLWDDATKTAYTAHGRHPVTVGETLRHSRAPIVYSSGFHACWRILDALSFGPNEAAIAVSRVKLGGIIDRSHNIILSAQERSCLQLFDKDETTAILRDFALYICRHMMQYWSAGPATRAYVEKPDMTLAHAAIQEAKGFQDHKRPAAFYAARGIIHAIRVAEKHTQALGRETRYAAEQAATAYAYTRSSEKSTKYLGVKHQDTYVRRLEELDDELDGMFRHREKDIEW